MEKAEEQNNAWVFQVLAGKDPKEFLSDLSSEGKRKNVEVLKRCIRRVVIESRLDREEVIKILTGNYYIGMKVYNHIVRRYSNSNPVQVCFRKSERLQIKAMQKPGKVIIYVPKMEQF